MCGSRKYPHLLHRWCFTLNPPPPQHHPSRNSSLASYFALKIWLSRPPHPLGISSDHPWGRYGYFLELHNVNILKVRASVINMKSDIQKKRIQNDEAEVNIHKINARCFAKCHTSFLSEFLPVEARRWTLLSSGRHFFIFIILSTYTGNVSTTHESNLFREKLTHLIWCFGR